MLESKYHEVSAVVHQNINALQLLRNGKTKKNVTIFSSQLKMIKTGIALHIDDSTFK